MFNLASITTLPSIADNGSLSGTASTNVSHGCANVMRNLVKISRS